MFNVVYPWSSYKVTVPINMNYDDPYQDLYIHLNKGTYKLNGKQAEQFCRFRKSKSV